MRAVAVLQLPSATRPTGEGYGYHGTREAHRQDVYRFNQLLRCPEIRSLLRFSAEDVFRRPAYVVAEIRATLVSLTGD
ncbi:hypothetical protein [Streptomyces sp. NPDC088760]|uniref:hypothetical protein n=1 Tax=Streptomyces sp. NPDC088760 TaxID=3365890 RepID=UPI00382DB684